MEKSVVLGFVCCAVSGLIAGNVCHSLFCLIAVVIAIIGGALIVWR